MCHCTPGRKTQHNCKPVASEIEWLRFFYSNAGIYFGPADSDVHKAIEDRFIAEKKLALPKGYEREDG